MLISIEGCIGVGKSTVARGLATHRKSEVLLEDFGSNPFLSSFSVNPAANAVETEFGFLLLHFHQLKQFRHHAREIIADFHLGKDLIYAELNLPDARWRQSFERLYGLCESEAESPGLLIYLAGEIDLVMARIEGRGRDIELKLPVAYYESVNDAYETYYQVYRGKKLRRPMAEWDFIRDPLRYRDLSALADEVMST